MKLLTLATLWTVSLLIFSGCGAKPTPQEEALIDRTLPVVTLTSNGVYADVNAIAFEWESISDTRVKGFYVYKMSPDLNETSMAYYDTIKSRFRTHYVDGNIKPQTRYRYYFKTFSDKAESLNSKMVSVSSLPVLESVSWIHSVQSMPRSAKILWRPHTNEKVKTYIIQRSTLEENDWETLASVEGRLNAEYIDDDLKDNYVYRYRVLVLTYDGITSKPSEVVKVITKALPKEVSNIVATSILPKKIKLTWNKSDMKDFASYNVYRSSTLDGSYDLLVSVYGNYYVDEINEDAKQYFYRVSSVDKDGLESDNTKHTVKGSTLTKPKAPVITEAKLVGQKIKIFWKSLDHRAQSYTVSKRYKEGWFGETKEDFQGLKQNSFVDSNIKPDILYLYQVFAIDKNHIQSEPSIEIKINSADTGIENEYAPESQRDRSTSETISEPSEVPQANDQDIIVPAEDLDLNEL